MIEFRNVNCPPLNGFSGAAPDGAVVGVVGERGSGKSLLLRLAAGLDSTESGEVLGGSMRRYIGPNDKLNFSPVDLLALDNSFALQDAIVRARVWWRSRGCAGAERPFCLHRTRRLCCVRCATRCGGFVRVSWPIAGIRRKSSRPTTGTSPRSFATGARRCPIR